jgi:hypothetical protein
MDTGIFLALYNTHNYKECVLIITNIIFYAIYSEGVLCIHKIQQLGLGIFLFATASRPALGLTHLSIHWVPGALSVGVKRPGREADNWPPSSAEV